MAQVQLFAETDNVTTLSELPTAMELEVLAAMERLEDNMISKHSKDVSRFLTELGFAHEQEVSPSKLVSGGLLAIDFACRKKKIAIEYDGSFHYLKALGTGKLTTTENGATKAKRRCLQKLGWTVINIDYREYRQAKRRDSSMVKQCLADKLTRAGVQLV